MKVLLKLKESFNEMKTVVTYTRSVYAFQEMLSRIWWLMYLLNHFNIWLNLNYIICFPIFDSKLEHNPYWTRVFRQFSKCVYLSSIEFLINIYPCFYKKTNGQLNHHAYVSSILVHLHFKPLLLIADLILPFHVFQSL